MFAPWIPETLQAIERLMLLPDPPTSLAVTTARKELVNMAANIPAPQVEAWAWGSEIGVALKWEHASILISASGRVGEFI